MRPTCFILFLAAAFCWSAPFLGADGNGDAGSDPEYVRIAYQGRLEGDADERRFKFALIDGAGILHWHSEGAVEEPYEPVDPVDGEYIPAPESDGVAVPLTGGFFSVLLGDEESMAPLPAAVFETDPLFLRVWVDSDDDGFSRLGADLAINPVPRAVQARAAARAALAEAVADGAVRLDSLALEVRQILEALSEDVEGVELTRLDELETELAAARADIGILQSEVAAKAGAEELLQLEVLVGGIEATLSDLDDVVSTLRADLDAEVDALDDRLESLSARAETLETRADQFDAAISTLQSDLAAKASQSSVNTLSTNLTALDGRVGGVEDEVAAIQESLPPEGVFGQLERLLALLDPNSSAKGLQPVLFVDEVVRVEAGKPLDYMVQFLYATHVRFADDYSPPAGLTLEPSTGLLRWNGDDGPAAADVGLHEIKLVAENPYTRPEPDEENGEGGGDEPSLPSGAVKATLRIAVSPGSMVFIPAGEFWMGDPFGTGASDQRPLHRVKLTRPFFMDEFEVSRGLYHQIRDEMSDYGYFDIQNALRNPADLPVSFVSFFSVLAWSNLRSEVEGLTPVYHSNSDLTSPIRDGAFSGTIFIDPDASGYRLPTEAEREYAARGGADSFAIYPWGNEEPSAFTANSTNSVVSVSAPFIRNPFNLNQMAGNVAEWCFDVYSATFYSSHTASPVLDPVNEVEPDPEKPADRVVRGGSYQDSQTTFRVYVRSSRSPAQAFTTVGFRNVLSAPTFE